MLILAVLSVAAADPAQGTIAPVFDAPDGAACEFEVEAPDGAIKSSGGTKPIEVAPGIYLVRALCDVAEQSYRPPAEKVRVLADRTAEPKIRIEAAKLRVDSRRGGVMLLAHVDLFEPGSDLKTARTRVPTNQSVTVAGGRYDVLVTSAAKKAPRAEVLFRNVRLSSKKKTILTADLSDGGVIVSAFRDGRATAAAVRAFVPGRARDVGLAGSREELRLRPGRYHMVTEVSESVDFAKVTNDIWVRPGKVERLNVRFDSGQLTVTVTADGLPTDAVVRLSHPGEKDFFNYFKAPGTVSLSPGVYNLIIASDAAGPLGAQELEGVRVKKRGHERRTIDLSRATLTVRVTKNEQPVSFAKIRVQGAGGGERVRSEDDGAFRLWPGRYEIEATLESGATTTDGPFVVKLGQRISRELNFDRAVVHVTARRGKDKVDALVAIYRSGATKAVATGKTGQPIEVVPGKYDVKVTAGADVKWQQGLRLKRTHNLEFKLPNVTVTDLPEGELPEGDDDLPEGE